MCYIVLRNDKKNVIASFLNTDPFILHAMAIDVLTSQGARYDDKNYHLKDFYASAWDNESNKRMFE